jgi:hypothetical protein
MMNSDRYSPCGDERVRFEISHRLFSAWCLGLRCLTSIVLL